MYQPQSLKDPFIPLIEKIEPLNLSLEQLKLVGILARGKDKYVLVELKNENEGYILKEGDLIGDAKLVSVNEKEAIFEQIVEKGRTVMQIALKLKEEDKE